MADDDFATRALVLQREHRAWTRRRRSLDHLLGELGSRGVPSWLWRYLRGLWSAPAAPPKLGARHVVPVPEPGGCVLTWLGHASVVLRWTEGRALVDPCFARSLYGIRRARAAVVPPGALDGLDVILVTHAHADHLHRPTLATLDKRTTIVVPAGASGADTLGFTRVVELHPDETVEIGRLRVTAVAARHAVGLFGGGLALGYVVEGDGPTVYVSGDTGYFPGFATVGERFRPEVAVLSLGGYRPASLRHDHLSPLDALAAFADLGADLMVPVHHSAFALGYEPLAEPIVWLRTLVEERRLDGRVAFLEPGTSLRARRRE